MTKPSVRGGDRPFPWPCPNCRAPEVWPATIAHAATLLYDGRQVTIDVPRLDALRCRACGEVVFDARVDEQVHRALRQELKLLTPDQIRTAVQRLGAADEQVAADLGVSTATFVRWATGRIVQPPAVDRLLRGYFASPATRAALRAASRDAAYGTVAILTAAEPTGHGPHVPS